MNSANGLGISLQKSGVQYGFFGSASAGLTGGSITDDVFQGSNNILFATGGLAFSNVRMEITSGGNVGIGATTPYGRLEIWGPDTASTTAFVVANSASTTEFSVYDTGNAVLAGGLTQNSDQRLKTNIQSLDASGSLAAIDALNPVTFNWIDPDKGTTPQLGFIAQQVIPIFPNLVSTTSATALTPDGTLSLNYIDLISPIVSSIQALSVDITSIENTLASFATSFTTHILTADTIDTGTLCITDGPNDHAPVCVTKAQLAALLSAAPSTTGSVTSPPPSNPSPTPSVSVTSSASSTPPVSVTSSATPPVIHINGDTPAIIQVGDSYTDLGATITGPTADINLGITTYVNGTPMNPIQLDTTQAATNTIAYVATDQNGLSSTAARTVIIAAAPATPADSSTTTPSTATTTEATSTAQ
jgi:hypothetical protein